MLATPAGTRAAARGRLVCCHVRPRRIASPAVPLPRAAALHAVVLDLGCCADISAIHIHVAHAAARALWPGHICHDVGGFVDAGRGLAVRPACVPADTVFWLKLVHDETQAGRAARASGLRRTRPLRCGLGSTQAAHYEPGLRPLSTACRAGCPPLLPS